MSAVDTLRAALYGNPPVAGFKPSREGVLQAFKELSAITTTAGIATYETWAAMDAVVPGAGDSFVAFVINDPDPEKNNIYAYRNDEWDVFTEFYENFALTLESLLDDRLNGWQVQFYSGMPPIIDTANNLVKYPTFLLMRNGVDFAIINPADYGLTTFDLPLTGSGSGTARFHYLDVLAIGDDDSPVKELVGAAVYAADLEHVPLGYTVFGRYQSVWAQDLIWTNRPDDALLGVAGPAWAYDKFGAAGPPNSIYVYPGVPIYDFQRGGVIATVSNVANVTTGQYAGYFRLTRDETAGTLILDMATSEISVVGYAAVAAKLASKPDQIRILGSWWGEMLSSTLQFAEPADVPRIALPAKLHAIVGREFNLYYDAMALLPDVGAGQPNMYFDVLCDIGINARRSFRVTPTSGQVGNHAMTVLIYNGGGRVIASKSVTLVVKAAANAGSTKRILLIGDSTTDDTGRVAQTLQSNLAALSGTTPTFIGTHGVSPYNHEARTGQSLDYFANGAARLKFTVTGFPTPATFWPNWICYGTDDSGYVVLNEERNLSGGAGTIIGAVWAHPTAGPIVPGWTGQLKYGITTFNVTQVEAVAAYSILKTNGTGALSFSSYMTRFGFAGCDLLSIDLGINDSRGTLQSETTQLAKIIAAKAIIDTYLAYNGSGKVMICLPKSCASSRNQDQLYDSYRFNIQRMRELLIENFDNAAYHANVSICGSGLVMDRYYGYPLTTGQAVAARYTETETVHGDQVHPRNQGYDQIADAMTATIVAILT